MPPAPPRRRRATRTARGVARLAPQKRLQDAIAAFERVVAAVPEARLDIFGEGTGAELQAEIDAAGWRSGRRCAASTPRRATRCGRRARS